MNWRLKLKVLLSIGSRNKRTRNTSAPISFKGFFYQFLLGFNSSCYWPVHFTSTVSGAQYITAGEGTAPGLSHGCYIFACKGGEIFIGDYTIIAPNVCLAGYNHDRHDYRKTETKGEIAIGKYSWIGANAVVLPGIRLGDHTIVAAGAVVTHSFPDGYCIIGGNPARVLSKLEKEDCMEYKNEHPFVGFFTIAEFKQYKNRLLSTIG